MGVLRWDAIAYLSASLFHLEIMSLQLMLRNVHPTSAATASAM